VVGHHRAGALERRLTGDIAEDVLRVATTPVLVVFDESRT
jgi:nucleotide-binding universal stress UspA family protein